MNHIGLNAILALAFLSMCFSPARAQVPTVQYGYDLTGRVASALYDDGTCVIYSYDPVGNRTAQTNSAALGSSVWGSGTWGCANWASSGPLRRSVRPVVNSQPTKKMPR